MSLIEVLLRRRRGGVRPTGGLAIPAGAVNGWGTAADFYDSIGVNVKVLNGQMPTTETIQRVAQMGIRHVRDGAIPSWTSFWAAGGGRTFWAALMARNRGTLPTPGSVFDWGHPIFLGTIVDPWGPTLANRVTQEMAAYMNGQSGFNPAVGASRRISSGVDFTPQGIMQMFSGGHQHYDGNASQGAQIPFVGNPDNSRSVNEPEVPWEIVAYVGGPNEPGTGGAGVAFADGPYGQEAQDLSPWMHALWVAKNQQTGQGYGQAGVLLTGNKRIVTEQGLATGAPSRTMIPVVGYVAMNADWIYDVNGGTGQSGERDMSLGSPNEIDVGDLHPYMFGDLPSEERMRLDGNDIGITSIGEWAYFNDERDLYNGSQFPSPSASRSMSPSRALPKFFTEWGLVDATDSLPFDQSSGTGPYASPTDVNAEYTVRQFLLSWYWGIRRIYYYQLMDLGGSTNPEDHFGFYDVNGNRKPVGQAVRNLLQLVGFSEPASNPRKLAITISGYPTGQFNQTHRVDGNIARQTVKKLHSFQIQQDDTHTLLVLSPQVMLWETMLGNRNASNTDWQSLGNPTLGRVSPATETLTITLPTDVTAAQVAWPTRGLTPNGAGSTWSSPDAAITTWDNLTITNNQITVTIDRYTKLVRLTTTGSPPPPPPPPPPPIVMTPVLGATTDKTKTASAATSLGSDVVRIPYAVTTAATSLDADMTAFADVGVKILPVATFTGTMPSQAQAENVATWATRFGPAGTFWSSYTGNDQPISDIEFGEETSYQYQYGDVEANAGQGDWWNNTTYTTRAANYATRFSQAKAAIVATGKAVGLMCQAEDGGSFSSNWVNTMYFAVSNLHTLVSGWTIHSFGPGWEAKMDRMLADLAAKSAPTTIPIDVTAIGVASDNGATLDDNLGWPVDETYAEAGAALSGTLSSMQAKATLTGRRRYVGIRQAHDLSAPGANTSRDNYIGVLKFDLGEKDEYSTTARSLFGGTPPPPPPPPPPTTLPIVVPSVGSTAATLRTGSTVGARLHLKGVNVWGLRDSITTTFGAAQYQARATVVATIKAWGGNCIRFRILADDYNGAPSSATGGLTKAQIIQQVKDWRDTVVGQGLYFCPCSWDALDGAFSDASWAGNGFRVHAMFSDIYTALGADPMVFYEVTNEPNNITFGDGTGSGQWDTNMRASILHFRETMGYKGVLVIDPINWANSGTGGSGYSDGVYSNIEAYDAARAGMGGKHQIVWAKHDYANEYNGKVWDPAQWNVGAGFGQIKHLIWENEFGNYNGSAATVDPTWSQNAAVFFRDRFAGTQNFVGAAPFLFGPWFDANAITAADNLTPTNPWGQTVRTNYLGSGGVTPPPPPVGWSPGQVGGSDWAKGSQASQALGAKVVRGHDIDPSASAASIDGLVLNYFNRGIRVFLLANFDANPSVAQAQNLATWATRFGAGGAFWQAHPELNESVFAVRHIEFGNEHSYGYRRGDGPGDASYQQFAQVYAQRFQAAAQAIAATGRPVTLLCQADDGGSGSPAWVNNMYVGVPNLHQYVGGWVVHPYGPTGLAKLQRAVNFTAARGAPGTIALDITEAGISSDNGRTLSDNYGWPTNLTYADATTTYQSYLNGIRADGQVGPRLRHWCYYQAYDQGTPGSNPPDRERFFGALKNDLSDKGAFSPYMRSLMAS